MLSSEKLSLNCESFFSLEASLLPRDIVIFAAWVNAVLESIGDLTKLLDYPDV
jgi:hypothetical protein